MVRTYRKARSGPCHVLIVVQVAPIPTSKMSSVDPQNALGLLDVPTNDPPPPYPSPERRSRALRTRRHPQRATAHISTRSTLSSLDSDALAEQAISPNFHPRFPSETTPLLHRRHRANSHASTVVSSSSFTQTVLSFCHDSDSEPDVDIFEALRDEHRTHQDPAGRDGRAQNAGRWSRHKRAWARYFRPMGRKAYHAAVFHLMVVNFPYALIVWIYLFVFTLVSVRFLGGGVLSGMRWWLMRHLIGRYDTSHHVAPWSPAVLP